MKKYTGYIPEPVRTRDQYVLGGFTKLPKIILQPDGQWDDFLPPDEFQKNEKFDSYNCTGFAITNALEILMKRLGKEKNWSERGLGIAAGTFPPGNTIQKVVETVRTKGLIDDKLLPFSNWIETPEEYYSPNPLPEVLKQEGLLLVDQEEIQHEWVDNWREALKYSPLVCAVYAWNEENGVYVRNGQDSHLTCVYGYYSDNSAKIFDSYLPYRKVLSPNFGFTQMKRFYIKEKQSVDKCWLIRLLNK